MAWIILTSQSTHFILTFFDFQTEVIVLTSLFDCLGYSDQNFSVCLDLSDSDYFDYGNSSAC